MKHMRITELKPCEIRLNIVTGSSPRAGRHPRVFVIQDSYLPGEKGGGPVWAIANVVERLGERFEFLIATLDRDFNATVPYPNIERNTWNWVGRARVFYLSRLSLNNIYRLIRQSAPDILYLNGFFSPSTIRALVLRRLFHVPELPTILAPHGEFSVGALQLKARKKKAYMALVRKLGLCRDVIWHASTVLEEMDIRKAIGPECRIHIAPELSPLAVQDISGAPQGPAKLPGRLRLVFLSRITPKKNLRQALEMLRAVPGDIALDIFGPIEDQSYWRECLRTVNNLPCQDRVRYCGMVPHAKVWETFARYHIFVLPTLGENFGYAIIEAMSAGCPVLISDRTPWRNLDVQRIGWDLPLDKPKCWEAALRKALEMDNETYASMSAAAREFARKWINSPVLERQTVALYECRPEKSRSEIGQEGSL